jgi:CspA family cold shock protein
MLGRILSLRDGFGLIASKDTERNVFFHSNNIVNVNFNNLQIGDELEFELGEANDGRKQAIDVRLVGAEGTLEGRQVTKSPIRSTRRRKLPPPVVPAQTRSAHFTIRDGLITTVPSQEIGPDENDYRRLTALQIPLLQLAKKSLVELSKNNKPFGSLLDACEEYFRELNKDVHEINYPLIYAYGITLALAFENTKERIEKGDLPDFSLDVINSTKAVIHLHGPFILSSKDGRDLVTDAERYMRDPKEERKFQSDLKEFGDILLEQDNLIEENTRDFIENITSLDDKNEQFERRYVFSRGAAQNLVVVLSAGAVVASTAFIPLYGPFVAASLGLLTVEAIKKSKPFKELSTPITTGLDSLGDVDLKMLSRFPREVLDKILNLVFSNQDLLRRVGGSAREMQWFRDVLDWVALTPHGGKGSIAKMTKDRGFGYICPDDGGKDIFFNALSVVDVVYDELSEGDRVTYDVEDGPKGPTATNVKRD